MTQYVLEILDGDRAGEVVSLAQDRVTIGRKTTNTLPLKDEKASGMHAEVVFEDGRYVLRDLGSTNGTLLDGKRVEEVPLTAQDVFQVGRVKIKFRSSADAAAAGGDDLKLHKVDAAMLARSKKQRRGGVAGMLIVLLLLAAGGGYLWYRQNLSPASASHRPKAPQRDVANLLKAGADSFEEDAAWDLRAAGAPMALSGSAHSGQSSCEASWAKPEAGQKANDFALARLKEPLNLLPGESLELSGWVRTGGGAKAALRVRFASAEADDPTVLVTGAVPEEAATWTEQKLALAVPQSLGRVQVELLALLPAEGASAAFDDVVLKKSGSGKPIYLQHTKGSTLVGTGQAVALLCGGGPALIGLRPSFDNGPLASLSSKRLLGLSDAGMALSASQTELGFEIATAGGNDRKALVLEFPGQVTSSGLLIRSGSGAFQAHSGAIADVPATEILLGTRATRMLLKVADGTKASGQLQGGLYELRLAPLDKLAIVTSFDAERTAAREALQEAKSLDSGNRFSEALALLRKVVEQHPHDEQRLVEASQIRNGILARLTTRLAQIEAERRKAEFLSARRSLVRVREDLASVVQTYGEDNLPDRAQVEKMRASVQESLAALDQKDAEDQKQALEGLRDSLKNGGMTSLSGAVADYLKRKFK